MRALTRGPIITAAAQQHEKQNAHDRERPSGDEQDNSGKRWRSQPGNELLFGDHLHRQQANNGNYKCTAVAFSCCCIIYVRAIPRAWVTSFRASLSASAAPPLVVFPQGYWRRSMAPVTVSFEPVW